MAEETLCPDCGAPLRTEARRGVCPRCLLGGLLHPLPSEPEPDERWLEENRSSIHLVLPDGATAALPMQQMGDYDLLEEVGHGGMGVIFKARQRSLDRIVALKVIRAGSLAKPADIARFRTEAAAAGRLQHPNIVAIYEVGEHAGQHFYSMEFVPGQSLARALRHGPFEPREASRILRAAAGAIHFAHQHGVLHRDLKPSNILLDAEGQPRVADFGLAKILQADTELTVSGAVMGSPQYMPPEQAQGRTAQAGRGSDIYSMGAIFYELLTGRPPFSAATPLETMRLVVGQEPIPPRRLNSALPRDLETICLKCLAKEPRARFATAQDLADELDRFLRDETIRSRPVGLLERAWRWCRREPALAGLAAVLALAPALVIAVLLVMGTKVSGERNHALRQEELTRQNLYAEDISLAWRALEDDDYGAAWRALAAHIPSNTNSRATKDLRGFEWRWLWHRVQGDARHAFPAHLGPVLSIDYSPDGRWAASASEDGTVKLWDAVNERWVRTLEEPGAPRATSFTDEADHFGPHPKINTVGFTADSQRLLTGSSLGLSLWETSSGTQVWRILTNELRAAVCSPTDPALALAYSAYPRTNLYLLNLNTRQIGSLVSAGRVDSVCFGATGDCFGRWDRQTGRVWLQAIPGGEVLGSFSSAGAYVITMAFTPDGRELALANMLRGSVEIFDVKTHAKAGELAAHTGRVLALAVSPDGTMLATGGADDTVHVWDLQAHREMRQLHGHRSTVSSLAFSADSRRLASGGLDGTVLFWDLAPPVTAPAPLTNVEAFAFSSDGSRLITQGADGLARLWDPLRGHQCRAWAAPLFRSAVILGDGGLRLAGLGASNRPPFVSHVSLGGGAGQPDVVPSQPAATNPEPAEVTKLNGIASPCTTITLSPDGQTAITGHQDGTVALWDAPSGLLRQRLEGRFERAGIPAPVGGLTVSADNQTVAAAGFAPVQVKTWSLRDGRPIASGADGIMYTVAFAVSPDGRRLATGGAGQGPNVNLWDRTLRVREMKLRGHLDHATALGFAPDGRTLATASVDGTVKLWHLATERDVVTVLRLEPDDQVNSLAFSPDGLWLGALTKKHVLHLFHAPAIEQTTFRADAAGQERPSATR